MNKLFKRLILIEKNQRMIISCLIISLLMLFSTFFFFDKALIFIPIFIFVIYFLNFFSLLEGIEKIEWFTLFLLPVLFTVGAYVFYFLFPVRWLTRLPFLIFYVISIYAIIRTSNILNVGADKNLQLYRAAFSINYFFQTITFFILTNFLFSMRQNFAINGVVVFILGLILGIQLFWSIKLNLELSKKEILYGLLIGLVLAQEAIVISFFTLEISILALVLTATYYCLSGLAYSYLDERLFKETIREYVFVLVFVFGIALLTLMR